MNNLIINKLKEIIKLPDIIKTDDLYNICRRKLVILVNVLLPIAFLRDIHERYLLLKHVDYKQIKVANELKNIEHR